MKASSIRQGMSAVLISSLLVGQFSIGAIAMAEEEAGEPPVSEGQISAEEAPETTAEANPETQDSEGGEGSAVAEEEAENPPIPSNEGAEDSQEGSTAAEESADENPPPPSGSTEISEDEATEPETPDESATTTTSDPMDDGPSQGEHGTSTSPLATSSPFNAIDGSSASSTDEEEDEEDAAEDEGESEYANGASITEASTTGSTTIMSGKAIAMANILNIVNTNLVNSWGTVFFSNLFAPFAGSIDFRAPIGTTSLSSCPIFSCTGDDVDVNLLSDAYIQNIIRINAISGKNDIAGSATSTIKTGDAYAGLNLVNVANTNFVDSRYLLVTLNAFEGLDGDIVFPNISDFFSSNGTSSVPDAIETRLDGTVDNLVEIDADSGNNVIEGNGGTVSSGSSQSSSNVFNQLNSTLAGGENMSILFRVYGDWAGEIFGLPAGSFHVEDASGIISISEYAASGTSSGGGGGEFFASSTALIENDVGIMALSGENSVSGASTALISTGNAYAGANLVNIANANVIGRNWILAIINIFGDFNGNISFGKPDLWVGAQIDAPSEVKPGRELTYIYTILNNGDLDATDVTLRDIHDHAHIEILEASLPYVADEDGSLYWSIGTLKRGEGTEVRYRARILNIPDGTEIETVVRVEERESDDNIDDNTDTVAIRTDLPRPINFGSVWIPTAPSLPPKEEQIKTSVKDLEIFRRTSMASATTTGPGAPVRQEIVIKNPKSQKISSVLLLDMLYDPDGRLVQEEYWDLGDVLANEEIVLGYDVRFGPKATSGEYVLSTFIQGKGVLDAMHRRNGSIILYLPEEERPVLEAEPTEGVANVGNAENTALAETGSGMPKGEVLGRVVKAFAPNVALAQVEDFDVREESGRPIPLLFWIIFILFALGLAGLPYYAGESLRNRGKERRRS